MNVRIKDHLALASCLLITGMTVQADLTDDGSDNSGSSTSPLSSADMGVLFYQEDAHRVQAAEGVIALHNVQPDESSWDVHLTMDALSGGSPNGALPSRLAQTFANPSGHSLQATKVVQTAPGVQTCTTASGTAYACGVTTGGSSVVGNSSLYNVPAGSLPLDGSFHDRREAVDLSYASPSVDTWHWNTGGAYSHEMDFQSMSLQGSVAQDFNQKNTTLSLGVNLEHDINNPVGGTPQPLSNYSLFEKTNNAGKNVADVLFGLTQIMTERWLTVVNVSGEQAHGYMNDPYKIVSGLDAQGNVVGYIFENRPTVRNKTVFFWDNRYAFDHDSVDLSLRSMRDSWQIHSLTADLHNRFLLGNGQFVELHYRWYRQSAAYFYRLYVEQGQPYLNDVSADPRLGAFDARTIGIKYGYAFDQDSTISVRLERYQQYTRVSQLILPQLQGLNLYPGLGATFVEADLQFKY